MDGGSVKDVQSKAELDNVIRQGAPLILHFWASWCEASKHMDQVFSHLSTDFPHVHFLRVEAEEQPEISEAYSVSAVPYFVFFKDGKSVDTLEGTDPSSLANKTAKISGTIKPGDPAAPASLGMAAGPTILESVQELAKENGSSKPRNEPEPKIEKIESRLQKLVNLHPIMLFMKGTPDEPKCGFSQKVVDILNKEKVDFGSFDILADNEVREGLKEYSNWPTFPQLYFKGELLGGCDIAVTMHESGELKEVFKEQGIESSTNLNDRLTSLINSSSVMLFMKGNPNEPKCGFSRKVVDILQQEKVEFNTFDILSDEEVRQGLKSYSNWSSYPQLYIRGELIGGSDIVLEMQKSGELKTVLTEKGIIINSKEEEGKSMIEDRLRKLTSSSPVMVFIKGNPDEPRCGFSRKVVDALREEGISFGFFDILGDEEVRQGLKEFSNWPTFPQVYCKGELIGGCDIVMEMKNNGELKSTLTE